MGGALILVPRTPAEHTALSLQQAADGDSAVLIPGAWRNRAVPSPIQVRAAADRRSTFAAHVVAVSGRERLERELEGGGAPSERTRGGRASVLTRLWRSTLHPTEIGIIWSRPVAQRP